MALLAKSINFKSAPLRLIAGLFDNLVLDFFHRRGIEFLGAPAFGADNMPVIFPFKRLFKPGLTIAKINLVGNPAFCQ